MNRTFRHQSNDIPLFLAKASGLSERAARAMCENGSSAQVDVRSKCNVITLRNKPRSSQGKGGVKGAK